MNTTIAGNTTFYSASQAAYMLSMSVKDFREACEAGRGPEACESIVGESADGSPLYSREALEEWESDRERTRKQKQDDLRRAADEVEESMRAVVSEIDAKQAELSPAIEELEKLYDKLSVLGNDHSELRYRFVDEAGTNRNPVPGDTCNAEGESWKVLEVWRDHLLLQSEDGREIVRPASDFSESGGGPSLPCHDISPAYVGWTIFKPQDDNDIPF